MLVKSGFSRFAEDSFGYTMQSSECISLLRCTRDIKPHLWGLHVADASLRGEIQLSWARVDTETNFMLMHRSIRNFNFPTPWKLNSWKLVLYILTPGTKIMFKCPTLVHFFSEKGKLGQLTGILLSSVPEEWKIYVAGLRTLNPEMSSLSKGLKK